ncbi:hypothetical protein ACWKW6_10375 [Dyadobacter jiangsuensis]
MARPIRETPVLTGRSAERFRSQLFHNQGKKASKEELAAIKKDFEFISSFSTIKK